MDLNNMLNDAADAFFNNSNNNNNNNNNNNSSNNNNNFENHMTDMFKRAKILNQGTKEEVLELFEKESKQLKIDSLKSCFAFSKSFPETSQKYDSNDEVIPLHSMKPLLLKNMIAGEVYRNHYIKLTTISSVKIMMSVMVMVEDDEGSFTELALYNFFQSDLTVASKYTIAEQTLAKGTKIIVKEPFFKVRQDGSLGIRIDNQDDLIFGQTQQSPCSFLDWKSEGNKLFLRKLPEHAMSCYTKALQCLISEDNMNYLMLLNLSFCCFKLKDYQASLLYGFASVIIGRLSNLQDNKLLVKAYYRLFKASVTLNHNDIADWSSQQIKAIDFNFWNKTIKNTKAPNPNINIEIGFLHIEPVFASIIPCLCSLIEGEQTRKADIDGKALKEEATKHFQEGDFSAAKSIYLTILVSTKASNDWGTILSNMSACSSEHLHQRSSTALASLCISLNSEKALYRLSESLVQMNCANLALVLCNTGTVVFAQNSVFFSSFSKLKAKILLIDRSGAQKPKAEFEKDLERNIHESMERDKSSHEMNKLFNMMLQFAGPALANTPATSDLKVFEAFPFHTRYKEAKCLPKKCNLDACYRLLEEGYELAKSFKLHKFSLVSGIADESSAQKRWGPFCLMENHKKWITTAKPGDLYFSKYISYIPSILQSFSNSVYKPGIVKGGMTQVSIGFVDLSSLIYNTLRLEGGTSVFKWIGYEMSSYSVAKALVLVDMMREATPEAVLQVWYSCAWTQTTESLFLSSVSNILDSGVCQDADVFFFLTHWLVNKATLKEARDLWLSSSTDSTMVIANFTRERDRNALISYRLTGQLLEAQVGSIVMCCNPPGLGDLAMNLEFLQTIYYPLLAKKWSKSRSNIIEVGITIGLSHISTWMQHLKRGNVEIEVRHQKVESSNINIIQEISSLMPNLVSWSNVPDYIHPEEFLRLANAVSSKKTINQFYSMNWSHNCFGVNAIDYPLEERSDIIKKSEKDISDSYASFGIQSLLTIDIIDNAINTTMSLLTKNLHQKWAESFLAYGRVSKSQIINIECQEYNHFHRGPGTVFAEFSFN